MKQFILLIAIIMSKKRQFEYKIGDRVAERPRSQSIFTRNKDVQQQLKRYTTQRYGEVIGFTEKKDSRGAKRKVVIVQWDGLKSPSSHETMRICPESEIATITKNTLVPGE